MALKIIIESAFLRGSLDEQLLQRVATVYAPEGREFRVYAPPKATGNALEWVEHLSVVVPVDEGFGSGEASVTDGRKHSIIGQVTEELQRIKRDANRPVGMNPDGLYYDAQICLRGHVKSYAGTPFTSSDHCSKCGSACITDCPTCQEPIRGMVVDSKFVGYILPFYCHGCGRPYPWMEERRRTAKDLLDHDDKLTLDDRQRLWGLLEYVMSDPKSDLAPAKKKLIEIDLEKAKDATKDFIQGLLAKTIVEAAKG
jgi:hypothetical protein